MGGKCWLVYGERLPSHKVDHVNKLSPERKSKMAAGHVYLQAPHGGEIKEVEATPEVLVPMLVLGWYQVPAPADRDSVAPIGIIKDAE